MIKNIPTKPVIIKLNSDSVLLIPKYWIFYFDEMCHFYIDNNIFTYLFNLI